MARPRSLTFVARAYIGGVTLLGLFLLISNLPNAASSLGSSGAVLVFLVLTACAAITQLFPVVGPNDEAYQLTIVFVFAGVLLLPPGPLALLVVLAFVPEWLRTRRAWHVQAFNAANFLIDALGAQALFLAISGGQQLTPDSSYLPGAVLAALSFAALNRLMLATVLRLAEGHTWRATGLLRLKSFLTETTLACLGIIGVLLWQVEPWLLVLIGAPLFLFYQALHTPALEQQARTDPKTGLYNARYLSTKLGEELRRAQRFERPLAVIMADLDFLRNVNNSYGHLAGDAVLAGVAEILKSNLREYDLAARFGGEEFAILLPESTLADGMRVGERLREQVQAARFRVPTSVAPISVTMSLGVAAFPTHGRTIDGLIHQADLAVYAAKLQGRNRSMAAPDVCPDGEAADVAHGLAGGGEPHDALFEQRLATAYGEPAARPAGREASSTADAEEPRPAPEFRAHETKGPRRRRGEGRRSGDLSLPVALLIFALACATAALWMVIRPWQASVDWLGICGLAVLTIGSQGFAIETYGRGRISIGGVFILAGGFLFGLPGALILALVLALATWFLRRGVYYRAVFDIGNTTLWGAAAAAVYTPLAHELAGFESIALVLPAGLAALVYYVVNVTPLSLLFAIIEERSPFAVWNEKYRWVLPYYLMYSALALFITFAYHAIGLYGLIAFVLPPAMMRFAMKQYVDRTVHNVEELQSVNKQLVQAHDEVVSTLSELQKTYDATLTALSAALDTRDSETEGHSRRVVNYVAAIADELGVREPEIRGILDGALLHDVGKIGVPDAILLKPGKLTPEEWEVMRRHPRQGHQMLEHIGFLRDALPVVLHHHERFDGRGYPDGLCGEEIPLGARIFAVADAFDALTSNRPYRRACSREEATEEIIRCSGGQFDPRVVEAFLKVDWKRQPEPTTEGGMAAGADPAASLARPAGLVATPV